MKKVGTIFWEVFLSPIFMAAMAISPFVIFTLWLIHKSVLGPQGIRMRGITTVVWVVCFLVFLAIRFHWYVRQKGRLRPPREDLMLLEKYLQNMPDDEALPIGTRSFSKKQMRREVKQGTGEFKLLAQISDPV